MTAVVASSALVAGIGALAPPAGAVQVRDVPVTGWSTPFTTAGAPTAVAGTPGNARVNLTWTAPASNGGSLITGYKTRYSSDGGTSWSAAAATGSTLRSTAITGLTNGTAYVFQVLATNAAGDSSWSSSSSSVTPRNVPGAPTALVGTPGDRQVVLNWTAPASNNGAAITGYKTQMSSNGGATWSALRLTGSTSTTTTHTGLVNGTSYMFRVVAVNAAGDSAASTASTAVVPYYVTSSAANVAGTPGNTQVTLTWTRPPSNSGSAITDYKTRYSSDGGTTWSAGASTGSASPGVVVTGLTNGTGYIFQVAATNAAGDSAWSRSSSTITPRTVPSAPTAVAGTLGNSRVVLAWSAPSNGGSAILSYKTRYSSDGGSTWSTAKATFSTSTGVTITGLTNGTAYIFQVLATNVAGDSAWSSSSSSVTPRSIADAPTSVRGTLGNAQVSLTWTAPANIGGSAITTYKTRYSSNGGATWSAAASTGSSSASTTITGLTNGTGYIFQVAATNAAGDSIWSSSSTTVTPRTVAGAPTAVAGTLGNAQVSLTWSAPASNGGSAITGYKTRYSTDNTTWSAAVATRSASASTTITGLTNGTAYYFQVAAINAEGDSAWSSSSSTVTPRTVAGAPTSVLLTAGDGQVTLDWTAPASNGGSAITGYKTRYSTDGGKTWSAATSTGSTATTVTLTGLANGTAYMFQVSATNAAGDSRWSAIAL